MSCRPFFGTFVTLETIFYICNIVSPHKGRGRKIKPGQKVHASIAFCKEDYYPKAILNLKDNYLWKQLLGKGSILSRDWATGWETLLELDIFDLSRMSHVIEMLKSETRDEESMWAYRLCAMASTGKYIFCARIRISNSEIQLKV